MSVIFDGEETLVHLNRGSSPFLLITFGGAGHVGYERDWYLMRDLVLRSDLNCIGFVSKSRNFFLTPEIAEIAEATAQLRSSFKTVIIIGASMGAYAGIKYSKLFSATQVLAFSPQYSMDPEELELDEGQKIYLRGGMIAHKIVKRDSFKTMAPRLEEVQGSITIIYDTGEIVDTYAVKMYEKNLPVYVVGFRHVGHFALDIYNSDVVFLEIIRLLRQDDTKGVVRFLLDKLRSSDRYIINILNEAARRKPIMCLRALTSNNARMVSHRKAIRETYIENILISSLYAIGRYQEAYQVLKSRHFDELTGVCDISDWSDENGRPKYVEYLVFSQLATFLAFDMAKSEIVFVSTISRAPYLRPILTRVENSGLVHLFYSDGTASHDIFLSDLPGARCLINERDRSCSIEVHIEGQDVRRLRATPLGKAEIVSSDIGQHESFTLVAVPGSFAQAGVSGGDWFEKTVMRHVVTGKLQLELPRRSPIARLLRRVGPGDRRLQDL